FRVQPAALRIQLPVLTSSLADCERPGGRNLPGLFALRKGAAHQDHYLSAPVARTEAGTPPEQVRTARQPQRNRVRAPRRSCEQSGTRSRARRESKPKMSWIVGPRPRMHREYSCEGPRAQRRPSSACGGRTRRALQDQGERRARNNPRYARGAPRTLLAV